MIKAGLQLFMLLVSFCCYSQKISDAKIERIEGYLIESFKYDSTQHVYNIDGYYIRSKSKNVLSSVFFPGQEIILNDCCSNKLKNLVKKGYFG